MPGTFRPSSQQCREETQALGRPLAQRLAVREVVTLCAGQYQPPPADVYGLEIVMVPTQEFADQARASTPAVLTVTFTATEFTTSFSAFDCPQCVM